MPNYISNFASSELSKTFKLDQKQEIGIAGFTMMACSRKGYIKSSSVPIIPLEDGSYATDHIIQNALIIEIEGTVGDIYEKTSALQNAYIRALAQIGNINRYLPDRTRQQINRVNEIIVDTQNILQKVDDYINSGEQLYNLFFANSSEKTISEKFINLMNALMDTDQVINIELPYKVYDNMVITSFQVVHPYEYANTLEFRLTAIQLRYSQTLFTDISKYYKKPSSSVESQTKGNDNKGINKTKDVETSTLSGAASALGIRFGSST